ncbi:hypothetical protein GC174_17270 [bacterium]|nr:hypothetical protein [bacterium]
MMNWVLYFYIILYAGISGGGIWMDVRSAYVWWIVLLDVLSSLYGLSVLILFAVGHTSPEILLISRFLYPAFIAACLFVNGIDLYDEWKESPDEVRSTVIAAVLAILFEVPCYVICYQYAFEG